MDSSRSNKERIKGVVVIELLSGVLYMLPGIAYCEWYVLGGLSA